MRTLPVSVAGVVVACGYAAMHGGFQWLPAVLCCLFALLAQVASNFANEYYDYKTYDVNEKSAKNPAPNGTGFWKMRFKS